MSSKWGLLRRWATFDRRPVKKIVHAQDFTVLGEQALTKKRADEASPTRDHNAGVDHERMVLLLDGLAILSRLNATGSSRCDRAIEMNIDPDADFGPRAIKAAVGGMGSDRGAY